MLSRTPYISYSNKYSVTESTDTSRNLIPPAAWVFPSVVGPSAPDYGDGPGLNGFDVHFLLHDTGLFRLTITGQATKFRLKKGNLMTLPEQKGS